MSYDYTKERDSLFTDEGQRRFLQVRDRVKYLLKEAGAFRLEECLIRIGGSSWEAMACLDRLVELGEIVEWKRECWGQYRVFTAPESNGR